MFSILSPAIVAQEVNGRPALLWTVPDGVRAVSKAVVGGGIGACEWIVNVEVDHEYHRDPVGHVVELASEWGLGGPGCGLLAAVGCRWALVMLLWSTRS
ncbi:adenosylcobinamide amidohydrolase [Kibdelosporangium philippinense]|uniref:Adenosylcobinamide amidohydrolase n=1 Tax=Kibdelosporangium philippinense TaxID=211113 RepID=A0ABS8Z9K1_9PSEU|nr:adenosylcobinamide amidohydrolase [Kibdelosporangium philippinense]MCE7002517.1 adenosylcobinamide amidohydrolase [Kibdelosporangium philippinense]